MKATLRVEEYVRADGANPYRPWFEKRPAPAAAKVAAAVYRLALGNTSRVKWLGDRGQTGSMTADVAPEAPDMALTRHFKHTVVERVRREPSFARHLLDEAATLFLNGEPGPARLILRDLVNATVGFERFASATGTPAKSLHRMLSARGNPSMDNLAAVFCAMRQTLGVHIRVKVHTVKAA